MTPETATAPAGADQDLAPVVEDMSAFIIAGAVSSDPDKFERDDRGPHPRAGDRGRRRRRAARLPPRLALRALGHQAGRRDPRRGRRATSRLEVGTGSSARPRATPGQPRRSARRCRPATATRFILGLGRGDDGAFKGWASRSTYARRWSTTSTSTAGCGRARRSATTGRPASSSSRSPRPTTAPRRRSGSAASPTRRAPSSSPQASTACILPPIVHPGRRSRGRRPHPRGVRAHRPRPGRDPHLRARRHRARHGRRRGARDLAHGRLVTYLQYPYYGDIARRGQRLGPARSSTTMRNHEQFQGLDQRRRPDLPPPPDARTPPRLIPDEWIQDSLRDRHARRVRHEPAALHRRRRRRDRDLRLDAGAEHRADRRLARAAGGDAMTQPTVVPDQELAPQSEGHEHFHHRRAHLGSLRGDHPGRRRRASRLPPRLPLGALRPQGDRRHPRRRRRADEPPRHRFEHHRHRQPQPADDRGRGGDPAGHLRPPFRARPRAHPALPPGPGNQRGDLRGLRRLLRHAPPPLPGRGCRLRRARRPLRGHADGEPTPAPASRPSCGRRPSAAPRPTRSRPRRPTAPCWSPSSRWSRPSSAR